MNPTPLARPTVLCAAAAAAALLALSGCGSPNKANIDLRKQNAELQSKVDQLQRQHDADAATIRGLESRGATTVPSLPNDRVAQLFTAHGLQLGRLTGGADLDPNKPGDDGLKVYVVPTDNAGQPLKAAGSFVVEAFDLARPHDNRIGHWDFGLDQAEKNWFGQAMLYTYVLACPWQQPPPASGDVTIRIQFTDALTGRVLTQQKQVKITPPPAKG